MLQINQTLGTKFGANATKEGAKPKPLQMPKRGVNKQLWSRGQDGNRSPKSEVFTAAAKRNARESEKARGSKFVERVGRWSRLYY